jgi:CHASE2 domain-containing sensor protein
MRVQSAQSPRRSKSWHHRIWQTHPKPFSSVIADWQFLVVLIALLVFSDWLGQRWVFERGSLAGTDILLRSPQPVLAAHCRLLTIDVDEFATYLGEPLDPNKLASVLETIIKYEPKVIVVDVDTSASRFNSDALARFAETSAQHKSRIVWARVSYEELKNIPGGMTRTYDWRVGTVLGNRNPQPEYIGSPLFPQDPDSTVRSFQRVVQIDSKTPALYWETLQAYCDAGTKQDVEAQKACVLVNTKNAGDESTVRMLHSDWNFISYPLSDLMNTDGNIKPQPGQLGDIVLLGGTFSDIHTTAFGPRLGIELTASALETELSGSEPRRIYGWVHWILKIALAIAIAWLNSRLMPLWATAATLLLLAVVFVASFLGIYYRVFQMDFLPFMIGIWIEQLVESSERAHHATH